MVAVDKFLVLSLVLSLIISSAIPAVCGFSGFPESPSGGVGGVFTGEFPAGGGTSPEAPFVSGFRHDSRGGGGGQPVAHWIFQSAYYSGGAFQDQEGNNNATPGAAPSYDVDGNWGLDGSSDYADIGDSLDTVWTGGSWTVELKFKLNASFSSTGILFGKDGYPGTRQFVIDVLGDGKVRATWWDGASYYRSQLQTSDELSTNTLYTVRVIYDSTQTYDARLSIYVGGIQYTLDDTNSGTPSSISNTDIHLGVGARLDNTGSPTGTPSYFYGSMEHIKIWDEVLLP
jgi:hypothetical protein